MRRRAARSALARRRCRRARARRRAADAHPLGNFSRQPPEHGAASRATASDVRYVLDQAEIPTVQERGLSRAEVLRASAPRSRGGLVLTVDGRRVALVPGRARPSSSFPAGAGGLKTTRVELPLRARVDDPRRVELRDGTFPGRVGLEGGRRRARARARRCARSAPTGDPTDGLRRYPQDLLTARSTSATATLPGRARRRHADRAAGPRRGGDVREPRRADGFAGAVRGRRLRPGRAAAAAAGRLRLGRAARALARPRQGDGGRLPGRHPRHGRGTRSRSARRSRSRTRSACSRSAS